MLFSGSGIARIGFIAAIVVAPLVSEDLLGSASLAGLPSAASTVGIAVGTTPIASVMARSGRRRGMTLGLGIGTAGVLLAVAAIGVESFPLFVAGMFLFGFGAAGDRLARYAAADISTERQRSFSISLVVWAGTIGAVVGPIVLEPVEAAAEALGLEGLAGAPLLAALTFGGAALLLTIGLRPDPLSFAETPEVPAHQRWETIRPSLKKASVRYAIIALVTGQVVMVLIMTMTPVHIRRAGEGLGSVGLVIGAHTFGMFAVSPLTGLIADRVGRIPVMIAGQAVLVLAAVMSATAGGQDRTMLLTALFLLGLGWNFGFVAGSAYLTEGAPLGARVSLQGLADSVVWTSSAAASLSSGLLLEATSYTVLSIAGAALVALPVAALARYRNRLRPPVPAVGSA